MFLVDQELSVLNTKFVFFWEWKSDILLDPQVDKDIIKKSWSNFKGKKEQLKGDKQGDAKASL